MELVALRPYHAHSTHRRAYYHALYQYHGSVAQLTCVHATFCAVSSGVEMDDHRCDAGYGTSDHSQWCKSLSPRAYRLSELGALGLLDLVRPVSDPVR